MSTGSSLGDDSLSFRLDSDTEEEIPPRQRYVPSYKHDSDNSSLLGQERQERQVERVLGGLMNEQRAIEDAQRAIDERLKHGADDSELDRSLGSVSSYQMPGDEHEAPLGFSGGALDRGEAARWRLQMEREAEAVKQELRRRQHSASSERADSTFGGEREEDEAELSSMSQWQPHR
eukprot:SAG11_NODE_11769_length_739_cov_0.910937_1_plen_175_part_10